MIFNQPGILLGSYTDMGKKKIIILICIISNLLIRSLPWILSDLADFDHIQLFLESGQGGVVIASRTLGDCAPFLGVWVVAAH